MKLTHYFKKRHTAFSRLAESEDGKIFLADLYKFCECNDPIVPNDPLSTGKNVGKELVAKHIQKVLGQDRKQVEELVNHYNQTMSQSNRR